MTERPTGVTVLAVLCVIGGLLASTFFTLWVVPLAYTVLDDLGTAVRAAVARGLRRPGAGVGTERA